jgi:hypothetical protein
MELDGAAAVQEGDFVAEQDHLPLEVISRHVTYWSYRRRWGEGKLKPGGIIQRRLITFI